MVKPMFDRRTFLSAASIGALGAMMPGWGARVPARAADAPLAPTPPMGWNSWNSFATTITEAQARETAEIMARKLLPFGYDVFTVDIQWYEPEAKSYTYNSNPVPEMDGYGRLLPAPNRFPSSVDGKGFGPLAQTVHALGLKFGIHLMRGIPRLAVERNLPVHGTSVRAADIANKNSVCAWNPDMYGVDMTKTGAQEYYDSVFRLYASWGVDFVKMDDMSRPYAEHAPEIEAAHRAIGAAGRPIVLSLSPGETPVEWGEHVSRHAQMWRISDDFWDDWKLLEEQFARLERWTPYRKPGAWPDADMLPLGRLALGDRDTKFTPAEQQTLMTLWAIARSPLIMGGDLRHLDERTLKLLTNRNVIAVNQASRENRHVEMPRGARAWIARPEGSEDYYLALFNLKETPSAVELTLPEIGVKGPKSVRDLWANTTEKLSGPRMKKRLPPHGSTLLRLSPV
jgi:alpha-galactosidase